MKFSLFPPRRDPAVAELRDRYTDGTFAPSPKEELRLANKRKVEAQLRAFKAGTVAVDAVCLAAVARALE